MLATRASTILRSVPRVGSTMPVSASLRSLGAMAPARSFHNQSHNAAVATPSTSVSIARHTSGLSVQIDAVHANRQAKRDFHCAARRLRSRGIESKIESTAQNCSRLTTVVPSRRFHNSISGGFEGLLRLVGIAALGFVGLYIVWSIIKALFHIGFYLVIGVAAFWIARRIRHHRLNQYWNRALGRWRNNAANHTSTLFPPKSFKEWEKAAEALKKGSDLAYNAQHAASSGQFVHPVLRFLGPFSPTLGNWLGTASKWIFNNLESQAVLAEMLSKRAIPALIRNPTIERYLGNELEVELINSVRTSTEASPSNSLTSVLVDFTVTGERNSAKVTLEANTRKPLEKIDWANFQDHHFEVTNIEVALPDGKTLVVPPQTGRIVDVKID